MKPLLLTLILCWMGHAPLLMHERPMTTPPEPKPVAMPRLVAPYLEDAACRHWVDSVMERLTLKERVGQLFIYTLAPQLDQASRNLLRKVVEEYRVGGLLFSGGKLAHQATLINEAQRMAQVPLLITFDGEWGLAMRLKELTPFPKNMVLGCIRADSLIQAYGREVGRQCRELGVQVNFAPVADVNVNPKNPVINVRSFGENPDNVARKVVAYSQGLEEMGVLSVSKHFPGHGDTEVDSHKSLPLIPFSRERLDSVELYPFRRAIEAGMGGVMVGHLEVPALEQRKGVPSSISRSVVNDLLVQEMNFQGLIFTDALSMGGAQNSQSVCLKALQAGDEQLLVPRRIKEELDAVMKAIEGGMLSRESIDARCRKVLTYKYALGLHQKPVVHEAGLSARVETPQTRQLIRRLSNAAITLLYHRSHLSLGKSDTVAPLPLDSAATAAPVLLYTGRAESYAPLLKALPQGVKPKLVSLPKQGTAATAKTLAASLRGASSVWIALNEQHLGGYQVLLNALTRQIDPSTSLLWLAFVQGRDLHPLCQPMAKGRATLLAHTADEAVQQQVGRLLYGKAMADGCLSASIGSLYRAGEGTIYRPSGAIYNSQGMLCTPQEQLGRLREDLNGSRESHGGTQDSFNSSRESLNGLREELDSSHLPDSFAVVNSKQYPVVPELDAHTVEQMDEIALEGIKQGAYPGCQIVVMRQGRLLLSRAYGTTAGKGSDSLTTHHLFDLASLSKTTGTLLAVMKLYDSGRLSLTDRLGDLLPWLADTDKKEITIRQLLFHESGLPPTILFYQEAIDEESYPAPLFTSRRDRRHTIKMGSRTWGASHFRFKKGLTSPVRTDKHTLQASDHLWIDASFKEEYHRLIAEAPLRSRTYRYSCVGFILLQQVVEQLTGMPLDRFLDEQFYLPMGLQRTAYLPLRKVDKREVVPSNKDLFLRKETLQGFVHDESAAFQGGVSGNAGLFSTAEEVAIVYQMLLNGGEWKGRRYLGESTCRLFTTATSKISRRGLGFDKPDTRNPDNSPCAEEVPGCVYGHTGFTGTCAWVDPDRQLIYVFLSNRTYPQAWNPKLFRLNIRTRIQALLYK